MARLHRMWANVSSARTLHRRAFLLIRVYLRFPFLYAEATANLTLSHQTLAACLIAANRLRSLKSVASFGKDDSNTELAEQKSCPDPRAALGGTSAAGPRSALVRRRST